MKTINCDNLTFQQWLKRANAYVAERLDGLTLDDLPDKDTWSAWAGGDAPEEFAKDVLAEEGWEEIAP